MEHATELFLNQCQMCGDLFEHTCIDQLCVKCTAEVLNTNLDDDPRDYDTKEEN